MKIEITKITDWERVVDEVNADPIWNIVYLNIELQFSER